MVVAAVLFGFRNEVLVPLLLMSGAPTAVSSYTMAQQMGGDGELAGEIVVFTTVLKNV
jgi:predicted permease